MNLSLSQLSNHRVLLKSIFDNSEHGSSIPEDDGIMRPQEFEDLDIKNHDSVKKVHGYCALYSIKSK